MSSSEAASTLCAVLSKCNSVRPPLRQAWELDDADKAEQLLRYLARRPVCAPYVPAQLIVRSPGQSTSTSGSSSTTRMSRLTLAPLTPIGAPSRRPVRSRLTTRQYARLLSDWLTGVGLDPHVYGTHSLRRTKATLIYPAHRESAGCPAASVIPISRAPYDTSASRLMPLLWRHSTVGHQPSGTQGRTSLPREVIRDSLMKPSRKCPVKRGCAEIPVHHMGHWWPPSAGQIAQETAIFLPSP